MIGLGEVIDIVRAVVLTLGQDVEFYKSAILSPVTQKLWMQDTLWIRADSGNRPPDTVSIGGTGYPVASVEECEWIIVYTDEDAPLIAPGTMDLRAPVFIHGTLVSAQQEMIGLTKVDNNLSTRLPLVYMVEQFSGNENYSETERLGVDADLRLFFLDTCDPESWLTADHWTRVIDPMNRLQIEFVRKLKEHTRVLDTMVSTARVTGHAKVGRYSEKKQETDLFVFPLSGIEWRGNAPIEKKYCC